MPKEPQKQEKQIPDFGGATVYAITKRGDGENYEAVPVEFTAGKSITETLQELAAQGVSRLLYHDTREGAATLVEFDASGSVTKKAADLIDRNDLAQAMMPPDIRKAPNGELTAGDQIGLFFRRIARWVAARFGVELEKSELEKKEQKIRYRKEAAVWGVFVDKRKKNDLFSVPSVPMPKGKMADVEKQKAKVDRTLKTILEVPEEEDEQLEDGFEPAQTYGISEPMGYAAFMREHSGNAANTHEQIAGEAKTAMASATDDLIRFCKGKTDVNNPAVLLKTALFWKETQLVCEAGDLPKAAMDELVSFRLRNADEILPLAEMPIDLELTEADKEAILGCADQFRTVIEEAEHSEKGWIERRAKEMGEEAAEKAKKRLIERKIMELSVEKAEAAKKPEEAEEAEKKIGRHETIAKRAKTLAKIAREGAEGMESLTDDEKNIIKEAKEFAETEAKKIAEVKEKKERKELEKLPVGERIESVRKECAAAIVDALMKNHGLDKVRLVQSVEAGLAAKGRELSQPKAEEPQPTADLGAKETKPEEPGVSRV